MVNYILRWLAVASSCVIIAAGCSRDAKKAAHLKQADEYFSAGAYEKAEIEYKNVLQQGPITPRALARLGEIYFDQGRILRAGSALTKAAELDPNDVSAQLKLGFFRLTVGQVKEAQEIAARVLERKPDLPEAPLLLAETALQATDIAQARAKLNSLPAPLPASAPVLAALATLELREQKLAPAFSLAERAVQADSKSAAAHAVLGRCQLAQRNVAAAEKSFTAAANLAALRSPLRLLPVQLLLQTGRNEDAKKVLAGLMERTPDFLPPILISATLLAGEKKHDESLALIDKILAVEPDHPEGLLLSAQNRTAKGEYDKALVILERAAQLFGRLPQVHIQFGQTYLAKGDLSSAATSFTQAIGLAPTLPTPSLLLAQVQLRQDKASDAIVTLKSFLQKNPRSGEALLLLAEIYQRQNSLDDALAIYRQFAQADPKNPRYPLMIGTILERQKKTAEARAAFDKVESLAPNQLPTIEHLANLDLAERKFSAAKARIDSYIEKHPSDATARLLKAKVLFAMQESASGEDELKKAIELQPDSPVAYLFLAQYYIASKQVPSAIANLQAAAAKNTKNPAPLLLMAVLHEQEKNYPAARENYEKVLALNPKTGVALNNLANLYSEEFNDPAKALDLAERARELMVNTPEVGDTLGWILYRNKQFARAEALLADSVQKLPANPEVRYHYGMASYMMGNEAAARPALEMAVQSGQALKGIDEAKKSLEILNINPATANKAARDTLIKAVEQRKDDPVARLRLAAIDQREGKLDEAAAAYEDLIKANPANVQASLGLIRIHQAKKENTKALELGRALRKAAPNDPRVAAEVGRLAMDLGDYGWSLALLQEAGRRFDADADVQFDLGVASYSMGQVANAEAAFNSALQASTNFPRAAKAREYLDLIGIAKQPADRAAELGKVTGLLKDDPSYVPALMAKAALDEHKGDLKSAQAGYEKALVRYPDFSPAKRQLAIYHSKTKEDLAKGVEYATKAREVYPTDAEVAKALGILLGRQGNHARAVTLLQESARARPNDGELLYFLGLSQKELKQSENAKASFQRALQLGLPETLAAEAKRSISGAK